MQFAQFSMLSEMCQSSANTEGWQMNESNNKESAREEKKRNGLKKCVIHLNVVNVECVWCVVLFCHCIDQTTESCK